MLSRSPWVIKAPHRGLLPFPHFGCLGHGIGSYAGATEVSLMWDLVWNWNNLIKCLCALSVSAPITVSEDKACLSCLNRSIQHMLRCCKVSCLYPSCWSGPSLASFRPCTVPASCVQMSQPELPVNTRGIRVKLSSWNRHWGAEYLSVFSLEGLSCQHRKT